MPSNAHFTLSILIGGTTVPEYTKNGVHYVECNLSTPVSYKLPEAEVIAGELEKQEWPVTPYSIKIATHNLAETCYFRVLIDGVKVKAVSLGPNAVSVIKGFRDDTVVREFLFSMPRFAKDSDDRLEPGRESNIGCIEVECWQAELKSSSWKSRHKILNFQQANKKDVYKVTSGEYTMVTSKVGKPVSRRSVLRKVDSWKRKELLSSLKLHYRMGHTLQEMGFTLRPCVITAPTTANTQMTQNPDIKQEVQGDSSTQTNAAGRGEHSAVTVIDLTTDSDEEMNVVEDGVHDLPVESGTKNHEEKMSVDGSGGGDVVDNRESVAVTASEKSSQIAKCSGSSDEGSVQDLNGGGQPQTPADLISDSALADSTKDDTGTESPMEQTEKSDKSQTLTASVLFGSSSQPETVAAAAEVTSSQHNIDSGVYAQSSGEADSVNAHDKGEFSVDKGSLESEQKTEPESEK